MLLHVLDVDIWLKLDLFLIAKLRYSLNHLFFLLLVSNEMIARLDFDKASFEALELFHGSGLEGHIADIVSVLICVLTLKEWWIEIFILIVQGRKTTSTVVAEGRITAVLSLILPNNVRKPTLNPLAQLYQKILVICKSRNLKFIANRI